MSNHLTDFQIGERNRREQLVREALRLQGEGHSLRQIQKVLREPLANLSRYLKTYIAAGYNADALTPETANRGRKALARLTPEQQVLVQNATIKTAANTKHRVATSAALRCFASDDRCSDEVREIILRPQGPTPTLRRQARVVPEMMQQHRNARKFRTAGFHQPQSLTFIDVDGTE